MRGVAKLLTLLSLSGLLFLTGCSKLKARDELNKGVRAYKGGDFETAIEHFQRANELDPTLLNARVYLATAYASQFVPGSPSEENKQLAEAAITEFERVLETDANNGTALAYIAQLYFGMAGGAKDWEQTQEFFNKSKQYRRRLIEVEPDNPEHYYSIGVIDWTLSYRPRMQLRRGLGLQPDQPLPERARRNLAEQNSAVVDEGIDVLHQAIQLNPEYLDAIAYLNLMYREKADIVASPQEREELLQLADETHERYQRLRKQTEEAPPTPGS